MLAAAADHPQGVAFIGADVHHLSVLHPDLHPAARRANAANAFLPGKFPVGFFYFMISWLLHDNSFIGLNIDANSHNDAGYWLHYSGIPDC
jgi:hypothetical protein